MRGATDSHRGDGPRSMCPPAPVTMSVRCYARAPCSARSGQPAAGLRLPFRTVTDPTVDEFATQARNWLADHLDQAPRDYGAILPPDLRNEAVLWQRRLFDAGFAGIHWPTEYGG